MNVIKLKLEDFNIEWNSPIIFVKEDMVTILSPFQILQTIESASKKVSEKIYDAFDNLKSREQIIGFLERLGERMLSVKI